MTKADYDATQRHQEVLTAIDNQETSRIVSPITKLSQKLLAIRKAVGKIEKRGLDDAGNQYARLEDILDAVNPLLDKHKLLFTGALEYPLAVGQVPLAKGCVRDVVVLWTVEDVPTGVQRSWRIPGSGYDSEYDGTGVKKAISSSRKAAYEVVFNLRTTEVEGQSFPVGEVLKDKQVERGTQAAADAVGDAKAEALRKRRETIAAKEFVRVTWPEAHHRNKALIIGRICIMEHGMFDKMQKYGKWNEREQGWYVEAVHVPTLIDHMNERGCTVSMEE